MTETQTELQVTRQRLLEAAGEVFAEQGFRAATVREICRRAGANVAAINYHFGDKERLYGEVLLYAHHRATEAIPRNLAADANATPEQRLRGFIHAMVRSFLSEGRPAWQAMLIMREIAAPSKMLDVMVDQNVRPRFAMVKSIIQDLLGGAATEDELRRCAWSVVGQCFFYRFGHPVLKRLHPPLEYDDAEIARIADHIANFSLCAIKELGTRKREQGRKDKRS